MHLAWAFWITTVKSFQKDSLSLFQQVMKTGKIKSVPDSDILCNATARLIIQQPSWLNPGYNAKEQCERILTVNEKRAMQRTSGSRGKAKEVPKRRPKGKVLETFSLLIK